MRNIVLCFMICVLSTMFAQKPIKRDSICILKDSIVRLNQRPVMTADQFLKMYKYDRLLKYYKICKRKPTQWKYYKGWSIRVFEQ
jgi:hypothetical protein